YLRRIGDLGRKAFTIPDETDLDEAIHVLSERKGNPALAPGEIARAEAALAAVLARMPEASEAARLARLYWWTAEDGVGGRADDRTTARSTAPGCSRRCARARPATDGTSRSCRSTNGAWTSPTTSRGPSRSCSSRRRSRRCTRCWIARPDSWRSTSAARRRC